MRRRREEEDDDDDGDDDEDEFTSCPIEIGGLGRKAGSEEMRGSDWEGGRR